MNKVKYRLHIAHSRCLFLKPTCASPNPSSILSRDCKMMPLFSSSRLLLSLVVRLSSISCRLSSRVRFSPRRASSPAITCLVLLKISSADNMALALLRPKEGKQCLTISASLYTLRCLQHFDTMYINYKKGSVRGNMLVDFERETF